jgi:hypothetical protein
LGRTPGKVGSFISASEEVHLKVGGNETGTAAKPGKDFVVLALHPHGDSGVVINERAQRGT